MVILNVDDDEDDRKIFVDAIKEINPSIICLTAGNAIEAQSLWSRVANIPQLDFIFLDINMPKMNGIELLEVLKKDNRFEQVPIYMLSTSCSEADISYITSLGSKYIAKQSRFVDTITGLSSIIYPTH